MRTPEDRRRGLVNRVVSDRSYGYNPGDVEVDGVAGYRPGGCGARGIGSVEPPSDAPSLDCRRAELGGPRRSREDVGVG